MLNQELFLALEKIAKFVGGENFTDSRNDTEIYFIFDDEIRGDLFHKIVENTLFVDSKFEIEVSKENLDVEEYGYDFEMQITITHNHRAFLNQL